LPAGLDDGRRDRVVAAAGAQRGDLALVVATRVAELVGRQRGMVQGGFREIGHGQATLPRLIGSTLAPLIRSAIASVMKRAVIGVPSKWRMGTSRAGSMSSSLTSI